jgi:hypothetical protein
MQTIREMISAYRSEVTRGNLAPQRAATILTQVAALVGNVNEEILRREMEYNRVLQLALDSNEKANRAKIRAEGSDEYRLMREARNSLAEAVELMRSLKYYLKVQEREFEAAKYQ